MNVLLKMINAKFVSDSTVFSVKSQMPIQSVLFTVSSVISGSLGTFLGFSWAGLCDCDNILY